MHLKLSISTLLALFLASEAVDVTIRGIVAPDTVQIPKSGHLEQPVIIDCDYKVKPGVHGFVFKWYFNDVPVYQWVQGVKPIALGRFKDRVNVDYEASSENFQKHRALAITNPSPELSGNYTCVVATFESMKRASKGISFVEVDGDSEGQTAVGA